MGDYADDEKINDRENSNYDYQMCTNCGEIVHDSQIQWSQEVGTYCTKCK